jgi:hypothetical protein
VAQGRKSGHRNSFDSYLRYRRRVKRAAAVPGFDPTADIARLSPLRCSNCFNAVRDF